jgi:superfamily II DNA or RNA helicase
MKKINLIWDDTALCIAPSNRKIEGFLSYQEKQLVPKNEDAPWLGRKTVYKKRDLFTVLIDSPGARVIQTHQGLMEKVRRFCQDNGWEVSLVDQRHEFVQPKLGAMGGFRFSQERLLTEALLQNRGGLIGAPTRYGKTALIKGTLHAFPSLPTVVTAPGIDLIRQLYADIKEACPHRKVRMIGGGKGSKINPSDDGITVCSMDSLHKCDHGSVRLVLVDEPHALPTEERWPELVKFTKARKYGFGATLDGRFDKKDILIEAIIGPVLSNITFKEAVDEGAICQIVVFMLKKPIMPFSCNDRADAYNQLLYRNGYMHKSIAEICDEVVPEDWQTLVFINNEKQADGLMLEMPEGTLAMAKKLTKKKREELMDDMQANIIKRCLATKIYAQGVTFHDVMAIVNAEGGGGNISCVQKAGRLAEIRPGKKCGVVLDFMFEPTQDAHLREGPWQSLVNESWARYRLYEKKEYEIHICEDLDDLKEKFQQHVIDR